MICERCGVDNYDVMFRPYGSNHNSFCQSFNYLFRTLYKLRLFGHDQEQLLYLLETFADIRDEDYNKVGL